VGHRFAVRFLVSPLLLALVLVTTRLGWPKFNLRLLRDRTLEGVGFSIAASTTSVLQTTSIRPCSAAMACSPQMELTAWPIGSST